MHSACVPGPTPMASGRAISAPPLLSPARLGHIGATAQHYSPLGARGRRLRGDGGKTLGRLLVKSPPGLGKTREAIHWAICYQAEQEGKDGTRLSVGDFNEAGVPAQTSIFVPRHHLTEELRGVIEHGFRERGEQIAVPILRGRENGGEEGNAPCRRWREARE